MSFWEAMIIALVPTVGIGLTVWASTRDLALRRKLGATDKFFEIVMIAHARAKDREGVGSAEQIAGIHLLADFGRSEKHLKNAAKDALEEIDSYTAGSPDKIVQRVNASVKAALGRLS